MKVNYTLILFLLGVAAWCSPERALAQENVTIESTVSDSSGRPLANADVYSGRAHTRSDANGRFTIDVEQGNGLVIEAEGYEKTILSYAKAREGENVRLAASTSLFGDDKPVQLAFRKSSREEIVGAVSTLRADEVNEVDNTIWAGNVLTGRMLGMYGSNRIRGIGIGINIADLTGSGLNAGNAMFVVDGLPRDIDALRLSEIESITVLKDANSAVLYGSAAVNGVILITTKRGEAFKQKTNFTVNYGVSSPRQLPEFLNSADYMTFYNQARQNDGLEPQFSDETIQHYRNGNPYRYPSVDYYSDEYLRSYKPYFDVMGEFSGGNENARYYSNIGWNSAGSLMEFGDWSKARYNTFNVRGNVDLKVNDWINTSIDGVGAFGNDRGQRGNYWNDAATDRPYEYTPLIPIDLIDPENELLRGRKNDINGEYLLGGNSNFITTPFGYGYSGGARDLVQRKFSFNNRIHFDLAAITKGLSFHTNISFDYYTRYSQTINNEFSVYEPVWAEDEDRVVGLQQHGKDARPGSQSVGSPFFRRRFGVYGLFSYDRTFEGVHNFSGSLLGFGSNFKEQGDFQGVKQAHLGFRAAYTYDRKYMVDFSSAYVNSVKLAEGNRGGFSPSLGLGWLISSEDFMASSANVDFLKLRLSAGIINSDLPIGGFYYYDNRYGGTGGYNWYEGTRSRGGVASSWSSNPNLGYAKRNEINFGVEGLFFDSAFGVEANVFYELYNDLVTRPITRYPSFYTDFIPYENFGSEEYRGAELGLSFNKPMGNWNLFIAANMLYVTSERKKVDEVFDNDYQYRSGHPVDATFGLEALGLFQDQADIDNSPIQSFGTPRPGDIKYRDQNNDGVIDANDEVFLRRWQAPFSGGLQLSLSYKNVTLFVLGEGQMGAKNFREGDYYWVDGNNKYSEAVLDSWTPETASTATYPRLSSQSNSNNFRRSSFWLYSNDYFQVRKVQLSWKLPQRVMKSLLMKDLDLFVDITDPVQFAKNREIRELRVGAEPYYRTFSIGLKADF